MLNAEQVTNSRFNHQNSPHYGKKEATKKTALTLLPLIGHQLAFFFGLLTSMTSLPA
jgi:hypothetical protein